MSEYRMRPSRLLCPFLSRGGECFIYGDRSSPRENTMGVNNAQTHARWARETAPRGKRERKREIKADAALRRAAGTAESPAKHEV